MPSLCIPLRCIWSIGIGRSAIPSWPIPSVPMLRRIGAPSGREGWGRSSVWIISGRGVASQPCRGESDRGASCQVGPAAAAVAAAAAAAASCELASAPGAPNGASPPPGGRCRGWSCPASAGADSASNAAAARKAVERACIIGIPSWRAPGSDSTSNPAHAVNPKFSMIMAVSPRARGALSRFGSAQIRVAIRRASASKPVASASSKRARAGLSRSITATTAPSRNTGTTNSLRLSASQAMWPGKA